jgi:hypothetical protein
VSWKNIKLIFMREVRDQLRDRRTLFMITILPLLLYPMLGLGVVQMLLTFSEQQRIAVILNADDLPDSPRLLDERRHSVRMVRKGQKRHISSCEFWRNERKKSTGRRSCTDGSAAIDGDETAEAEPQTKVRRTILLATKSEIRGTSALQPTVLTT